MMSFCMSMSAIPTLPLQGNLPSYCHPVYPLGQQELKPPCHPRDLSWCRASKGLGQAAQQRL